METAAATQLVDVKETAGGSTLVVSKEGEEFLNSFSRPLAVIVIAGPYRTGKSFLSNQLLGSKDAFVVGHTTTACTRGIWASKCSEIITFSDGTEGDVLLLDTEGLGATDKTAHYDDNIFMLAALLASTMIYNSQGSIDEKSIQKLTFIAKMRQVLVKSETAITGDGNNNDGDSSQDEDSADKTITGSVSSPNMVDQGLIFPAFIWTLRDFSLKLVTEDGVTPMNSNQYMEKQLQQQPGFEISVQRRNKICQMLRQYFTHRQCFTFCRPVGDEEQLQSLSTQEECHLRPEFVAQIANFKTQFWRNLKPKRSQGGRILTGPGFYQIIVQYVHAINKGGVPVIGDAWTAALQAQCKSAQEAALVAYNKGIENLKFRLPLNYVDVQTETRQLQTKVIELYNLRCRGTREEIRLQGKVKLTAQLTVTTAEISEINYAASKSFCKDQIFYVMDNKAILQSTSANSVGQDQAVPKIERDVTQIWTAWDECVEEYNSLARGPAKNEVLLEFGLRRIRDDIDAAAQHTINNLHKTKENLEVQSMQTQALEQRKSELEEQHKQMSLNSEELETKLLQCQSKARSGAIVLAAKEDEITNLKRTTASAEANINTLEVTVSGLKEETSKKSQRLRHAEDQVAHQQAKFNQRQQELQSIHRKATHLRNGTTELHHILVAEVKSTIADISRDVSNQVSNHIQLTKQQAKLELIQERKRLTEEADKAQQIVKLRLRDDERKHREFVDDATHIQRTWERGSRSLQREAFRLKEMLQHLRQFATNQIEKVTSSVLSDAMYLVEKKHKVAMLQKNNIVSKLESRIQNLEIETKQYKDTNGGISTQIQMLNKQLHHERDKILRLENDLCAMTKQVDDERANALKQAGKESQKRFKNTGQC